MLHEVIRFTVNFQPNNNIQSGSAYNVVGNGYNTVFPIYPNIQYVLCMTLVQIYH